LSHNALALLITAGALAAGALETVATASAVLSNHVGGAGSVVAAACLFGIAVSRTGATNGACGRELAVPATILVGFIAHGATCEFAGLCIATLILGTASFSPAVAIFAFFDNAVAALLLGQDRDALVARQATGVDAPPLEGGADVANGARTELLDLIAGRGVHDELTTSIASSLAEGAAH